MARIGPVDAFIFTGPCYLMYGASTRFTHVTLTMNHLNNDGGTTTYTLQSETFTAVEGVCFGVTITPEAGTPKFYPVKSILEVGPNAWGVLQPLDGGGIGIGLAITQNGQDFNATFAPPQATLPPRQLDPAAPTTFPSAPKIQIVNGTVNNGLSDESLVSVSYQLLGGRAITTPPAPPGQQTGPVLSATLLSFQLQLTGSPVAQWYAVEDLQMEPMMSLVVIGNYATPSLTYSVPIGPWKTLGLTKVQPD